MIIGSIVPHNANLPLGFVKSMLSAKDYQWVVQEGPVISMNRNAVFERARIEKQDLLFIDSDMVFTYEDVKKIEGLLKEKEVVTGVCVMGFRGYPPAIFKKVDKSFKLTDVKDGIFEVDACGAAFLGISYRVINYLTEPFEPLLDGKYGQKHGEDISFCIRAKEAGFKIWCDSSLRIGHIKTEIKYHG